MRPRPIHRFETQRAQCLEATKWSRTHRTPKGSRTPRRPGGPEALRTPRAPKAPRKRQRTKRAKPFSCHVFVCFCVFPSPVSDNWRWLALACANCTVGVQSLRSIERAIPSPAFEEGTSGSAIAGDSAVSTQQARRAPQQQRQRRGGGPHAVVRYGDVREELLISSLGARTHTTAQSRGRWCRPGRSGSRQAAPHERQHSAERLADRLLTVDDAVEKRLPTFGFALGSAPWGRPLGPSP